MTDTEMMMLRLASVERRLTALEVLEAQAETPQPDPAIHVTEVSAEETDAEKFEVGEDLS